MRPIKIFIAILAVLTIAVTAYVAGSRRANKLLAAATEQSQPHGKAPIAPAHSNHGGGSPHNGMPGMDAPPNSVETMSAGAVMLTPQKQQLIGIRTTTVASQPLRRTIRTVGRVEPDETRIAKVHTKFSGWVEKVFVDFTGKLVERGQPLFSIYSPELVSTQQEYLISLRGQKNLADSPYASVSEGAASLRSSARERLRLWDIADKQIEELERSGKASRTLEVSSPINGYVMERKIFDRVYITPETDTYTIVDLSKVWVNADIYEYEVPYVRIGQKATMQLPSFPGRTFTGTVTYIYPTLDMNSRTVRVRLEFANPRMELKPNMFADVEFTIDYGRQLLVPAEAVLESGTRQLAFIARPNGYFEPRELRLGARVEQQYIVLSGVKAGEAVVTSGNFLLDSESRLSTVTGGMAGMKH